MSAGAGEPSERSVRIALPTSPPCTIVIGRGVLASTGEVLAGASAVALVSDANVAALHAARLGPLVGEAIVVPPGEATKSFAELEALLERLAERALDRRACLVALGGGVVGDLVGLAASLYMRGIDVVQCPTTLLAQVDASVGGKTAVNLRAGKNLAGTFHQPRAVFVDTDTLATLPDAEFRSGLGEVVKSALVGDEALFELLERESARVLARDPELLPRIVERCLRVKAAVVSADEREQGERRVLNLGHTFAHAIERTAGYGVVPHGVAVATGLALAFEAAALTGILEDRELEPRVARLLVSLGLPPDLARLRRTYGVSLPSAELVAALRTDKKGARGRPLFVLPRAAGALRVDVPLEPELLRALLA